MTSKKFKTGNIVLKNPTQQFKPSKIGPRSPIPFSVSRNSSKHNFRNQTYIYTVVKIWQKKSLATLRPTP